MISPCLHLSQYVSWWYTQYLDLMSLSYTGLCSFSLCLNLCKRFTSHVISWKPGFVRLVPIFKVPLSWLLKNYLLMLLVGRGNYLVSCTWVAPWGEALYKCCWYPWAQILHIINPSICMHRQSWQSIFIFVFFLQLKSLYCFLQHC